jgi:DNA-binding beta-propeller fold protein YncE
MGVSFYGDATSVAVDSQDNVYVFNRGTDPVCVFSPEGDLLRTMLHGTVTRPHGIEIDPDDNIYVVDDDGHYVRKFDQEGVEQFTIGVQGEPCEWQGGGYFNRPTDIAIHPDTGELFVSDGYGNSRVHRFDADGNHILSWGEPGTDDGKFNLPHNIAILDEDLVIVCDRESHRVQVFTVDGDFVRQWPVHKATGIEVVGKGTEAIVYIGEQGPAPVQRGVGDIGNRVSIYDWEGDMLDRFGNAHFGEGADQFLWPHSVAIDSRGDVYIAEVSFVEWGRHQNPPVDNPASLRKWRRKG